MATPEGSQGKTANMDPSCRSTESARQGMSVVATAIRILAVIVLGLPTGTLAQNSATETEPLPLPGKRATAAERAGPKRLPPVDAASRPAAPGESTEALPGTLVAPSSLPEFERLALSGNPALARAAAQVGVAQGVWQQVGIPPNPSLGYSGQQIGSGGLAEQHGIFFNQEVVVPAKLRWNRAAADADIERARQEALAMEFRVLTDVRTAYYEALIAGRQVALTRELVQIAQRAVETANALFRAEEVGRVDVVQAELEVEAARIESINATNRLDAAWRTLSAVTGQPDLVRVPLMEPTAPEPWPADFEAAWQVLRRSSPEIAGAMAEIEAARSRLRREEIEPLPNLTVEGLINWIDNGTNGSGDGGVIASVPVPIWDRNQGNIRAACYEVVAAEHALTRLELDLRARLAPVFERYAAAREQVTRFESKILPAAREALDLTRRLYESGEADFLLLLTAQRSYSETNLRYLDVLRELRLAEVEIDGMLLAESLSWN